jgi:hypothetical protein
MELHVKFVTKLYMFSTDRYNVSEQPLWFSRDIFILMFSRRLVQFWDGTLKVLSEKFLKFSSVSVRIWRNNLVDNDTTAYTPTVLRSLNTNFLRKFMCYRQLHWWHAVT